MARYQYGWRPYVRVAERRASAARRLSALGERGLDAQPVVIEGRKIARTFWGEAWCAHLERFSDYANRLPRGRTYVRNGSVCHLDIVEGAVEAKVSGSSLYDVHVEIDPLSKQKWTCVKAQCVGKIGSLLELLQGRLSEGVMSVVCDRDTGLFPLPKEIRLQCSCPDWAVMCKHVAAVLYGVGARLDERPELLFLLRGVKQEELIGAEAGLVTSDPADGKSRGRRLSDSALADVFGIEMVEEADQRRPLAGTKGSRKKRGKKGANGTGQSSDTRPKKTKNAKTKSGRKNGRTAAGKASRSQTTAARAGKGVAAKATRKTGTSKKKPTTFTGRKVARLRVRFGMSQNDFGRLLGVSGVTVGLWERGDGPLHLQQRTRAALEEAASLTKREALARFEGG